MHRILALLLSAASLSACLSVEVRTGTPVVTGFVTSTLPPAGPIETPPPVTQSASAPGSATSPASTCTGRAVLLADVTIPDNTPVLPGSAFTKTWRFKNPGSCAWDGYTIEFVAGDQMGASESSPVASVAAGATTDISLELTAPVADGLYTGYFELHDAAGGPIPIGIQASFWVRIVVGNVVITAPAAGTPISVSPLYTPGGPLSCDYFLSIPYHGEIAALINTARLDAGLPALAINAQLAAAAQDHSIDMACFGLLSHTGSNSSSPGERVAASGYSGFLEEIIFASGYPHTAFDWWMNDQVHRDAILNPRARSMGVGYAHVETSLYGGYYTVDFGNQ
jgi:hypothetical protein